MEMEPHRKSREAMAAGEGQEDRLSSLPDDVLHSILGGFPLKDAVRTSALSRRWASLWIQALTASGVLDFTDRGFVRSQSPAQIVATVNRCLRIHGDAEIDVFRVAFSPFDAFRRDVVGWVADALGRGAKEVEVDLTQGDVLDAGGGAFVDARAALELPGELFRAGNSLAGLRLGQCSLRDVPPDAAGLAGLRSLSLDHVDVTDEAVRSVVSNCRLLEFLSLRTCHLLTSVRISGERLRGLEIAGCLAVRELVLAAPALESFAFHGDIVYESDFCGGGGGNWCTDTLWQATPALRDAYLSHVGFGEYEEHLHESVYSCFLHFVAHARILTICSVGLLHIQEERMFFELMMDTPNLEELQLLMDSIGDDDVTRIACFLELIESPLLERLFLRLPGAPSAPGDDGSVAPLTGEDTDFGLYEDIVLGHLRFIKVVNFRATSCELRLLEFLLDRTPALEYLVLVTPEEEGTPPGDDEQQQSGSMLLHLKIIEWQVSMMRKASPEARVAVCRLREDGSRNPAHTTYYHEKCSSGAVPSVYPCRLKFKS